jgi:hypothetical protein
MFTSGAIGKLQEICADILVFQWRVPTDLSQKNLSPALSIQLTKNGKQRQTRRERWPHPLNDLEIIYTTGYTPLFQSAGKCFYIYFRLAYAKHGFAWYQGNAWQLGNECQFLRAGKQEYADPSKASSNEADSKELDAEVLDVLRDYGEGPGHAYLNSDKDTKLTF